jgi:hypothetical protein
MCHRSVGLVQGELERAGISTASVTVRPDVTVGMNVPRAAYLRFPHGNPLGEPHRPDQQHLILEALLQMLETATEAPTLIELPFRWKRWERWL